MVYFMEKVTMYGRFYGISYYLRWILWNKLLFMVDFWNKLLFIVDFMELYYRNRCKGILMREFFSPFLTFCKWCILLLICLLKLNKVVEKKKILWNKLQFMVDFMEQIAIYGRSNGTSYN